jgi:hypothetical protein
MKGYVSVEVQLFIFLTSASDGVSGQFHAPATLPAGRKLPVSLNRRLAQPQRQCGRFGEEKTLLLVLRTEPQYLTWPAHILVAVAIMLTYKEKIKSCCKI